MSLYRLLLRSLRRPFTTSTSPFPYSSTAAATTATTTHSETLSSNSQPLSHFLNSQSPNSPNPNPSPYSFVPPHRDSPYSSAEEAAAERRRRKRRLRIEPPLNALRRDHPPSRRDPNAPRLPDSTSALVGPRLNLHNRVQSLIRASDLDAASAIARRSVFSNTRPTVFTCNAIIAANYRSKRYNDAVALFQFFFNQSNIVPNIVSYNNLINTHCDEGRVDVALEVYREILAKAPFSPSPVTYRHLTKGLIDSGRIGEAVDLLREMLNKGHGADSLVYNNLIAGFLNLENLEKANELFDELKERCLVYDGVVNATYMDWFFNKGREKEAMESYKSLLDRQFRMIPATCNTLLEVLLKHNKKTEAWALFEQMLDNHTPPTFQAVNSDTFNVMVNDCFKLGKVSEAVETFRKAGTKQGSKPFQMDVAGYNNIMARFCEIGMFEEAEEMFEELKRKSLSPDVTSYRTLINAYLDAERIDDVLRVFTKMVDAKLRVVAHWGNTVFGGLIKNGKAVNCAEILTKMGENDPKPDPVLYEVMIRGVCDEGAFDLSKDLLDQMMRYGVGVTPTLQEFVKEAFARAGRGEEIERLLNANRWGYAGSPRSPSGPPRGPSGPPPRMGGPPSPQMPGSPRTQQGPPYMGGPPQMGGPDRMQTYGPPQMGGPPPPHMSGLPRTPQGPSQIYGPDQTQPYGPPQMAAGPRTAGPSYFTGPPQTPSAPSYMAGPPTMPPGPSSMAGSPQMAEHLQMPSEPPQTPSEPPQWAQQIMSSIYTHTQRVG